MTAVCWRFGPGVGLWLPLMAGAGGNAVTSAVHGGDHLSVGASTATFGAIGIPDAQRIIAGRAGAGGRKSWVVIAATDLPNQFLAPDQPLTPGNVSPTETLPNPRLVDFA